MASASKGSQDGSAGRVLRRGLGYLLLMALLVLLLWFWLREAPVKAEVSTVTRGPMQVSIDNLGQVRAMDRYVLTAPVAAEVQRIALREGDRVERDQVVAVLDLLPLDERQRQEAQARLQAAQARSREAQVQVKRAESELRLAASELKRNEQLVQSRFIAPQAAEKARTAESTARAELAAARSRVQAALADLRVAQTALLAAGPDSALGPRSVQLRSPVAGHVLRIPERSERSVPAGTPLVTIGDPGRFEIVVDVLSTDAVKIRPGNEMLLVGWGGEEALRALVRLVEPVAFTKVSALGVEEQRVNVIADPVDALGVLGDGYRVEARVVIWSSPEVLKLPGSSLFRVGESWHAFRLENGRAREVEVKLGHRNRDEAEVLGGLAQGDVVLRFPGSQVRNGTTVEPLPR